ncbi:asparagine synthase (glutamine-hydrolyzing) [Foetidibacter luteolus]|uniref:asparagine synthase (glutamine-hydrolyzing) n=1 Tax=Foetidibacter luteolus TaxID=2608880 RepID=UPI00129B07C4|nr:asparagine synthase (glutamine-hydrolyzing) [Foetidibacter luteolus]
MCGIAGIYHFKRKEPDLHYMNWCLSTMRRRGPDASGIWHNQQNYTAGFVRLSIRDLSANGHQPMLTDCGNYCISFNGEIYNTGQLQQLLKPYRSHYASTSDTEVLLYALMHLGIDKTLQEANGIFAFAFFDVRKNTLVLARDRAGIKPLYVGVSSNTVVYSSQYDHVINHPEFKAETWSSSSVANYLSLGFMPDGEGVINNTWLFPHAHYAVVQNGTFTTSCYYSYPAVSGAASSQSMEECLQAAVSNQLVSDVPVGTFMSGGVDSTLVSYYANSRSRISSFTIGVQNSGMDESADAEKFAAVFNTVHSCRFIEPADLLALIQDNARAFTEPFADYSSIPTLLLSAFARQKVTVALSGDGGDELFWGYPRNNKALNLIPFYRNSLLARRATLLLSKLKSSKAMDLSRHWNQRDFFSFYYSSFFISGALQQLPSICRAEPSEPFFLKEFFKTANQYNEADELMNAVRKLEMDIHLQRILLKVDRASMYHSLEVRVPLLDNTMLNHSLSYGYKECIVNGNGKMNLKRLLSEKSDESWVMKPKKGFIIPIDEWTRNVLKKEVQEKIMDMPQHLSMFFNRGNMHRMLNRHFNGQANLGWMVWAVYSLVVWDNIHRNKL